MDYKNQNFDKFLGELYDILIVSGLIKYKEPPKDIKEKRNRVKKYLEKLKRLEDSAHSNERLLNILRNLFYDRYIIKREAIPEKYFRFLEKQYLEQGKGRINLVNPKSYKEKQLRENHINTIINSQKESLDNWLNYLFSKDSSHMDMWAKVWAFQGMLHIGNLNKKKQTFDTRGKTTVNPFVELDEEILCRCVELLTRLFSEDNILKEESDELKSSGTFAKIYGKLLFKKREIRTETNDGMWIKYCRENGKQIKEKLAKGKEPEYIRLYKSLQGYNTGWCTAGSKEIAKMQLFLGDFYVYYSKDESGKCRIPRVAIRMENDQIGEIRGILLYQKIEHEMSDILDDKLEEIPNSVSYKKKTAIIKKVTVLYNKFLNKENFTKEELIFLYTLNHQGYKYNDIKDIRVSEILQTRDVKKDFSYVFDCTEDEVGICVDDLKKNLKCYYGNLEFFSLESMYGFKLPNILFGNLKLWNLRTLGGIKLPERIDGELDLSGLTSAKDLKLPDIINGDLFLRGITSAEDLKLPDTINGGIYLGRLTSAKGLKLPDTINGTLNLGRLTSTEGLKLPDIINGDLYLSGLTGAEDLMLPQKINGGLDLSSLISAEGLKLPDTINGGLYLGCLTSAEGLKLPNTINGALNLSSLTSAEGLKLPDTINGALNLSSLTSAEGLKLPDTINGALNLSSLTSADGITWPEIINGELDLSSLISVEDLKLPETINGSLYLGSLTSAENLKLPKVIKGKLNLGKLTSLVGIVLPEVVNTYIEINENIFRLEEIIKMQKQGITLPPPPFAPVIFEPIDPKWEWTPENFDQPPNKTEGVNQSPETATQLPHKKKVKKFPRMLRTIFSRMNTGGFTNNILLLICILLLGVLGFVIALLVINE